jgi:hypothetical protein
LCGEGCYCQGLQKDRKNGSKEEKGGVRKKGEERKRRIEKGRRKDWE